MEIRTTEPTTGAWDARLIWPTSSYEQSLDHHLKARAWLIETGIASSDLIAGTLRQTFRGEPYGRSTVLPLDLLASEWAVEILLYSNDPHFSRWLRAIGTPEGARLVFPRTQRRIDAGTKPDANYRGMTAPRAATSGPTT